MPQVVFSTEEKEFLQQIKSQRLKEQQRVVGRLLDQQEDLEVRRFLQNLYCKLQNFNDKKMGETPEK